MRNLEQELDFVIPICNYNIIIRVTIESIIFNYKPNNIFIIINKNDVSILEKECLEWDLYNTKINIIDEEDFFISNYGLTKTHINEWYTWKDENSREYGWWYQQLIKIGSFKQIKNLSDPYVVWDSDLIVLKKWCLYNKNTNQYKIAILQESAKNEFNKNEYAKSINKLIGIDAIEPPKNGTFVSHHFIIHHKVIIDLINKIENIHNDNWIKTIMLLSKTYYRFSEYKCISTFMNNYFPELLSFYPFEDYGRNGIRYRESNEIIKHIIHFCKNEPLTYELFKNFILNFYKETPSYIQIEHVETKL